MNREPVSQLNIFFIVGRGRSGTTVLQSLLDTHPDLLVAPEALFIMNLYKKYAKVEEWDEEKLLSFYDELWLEKRLEDWQLDRARLKQDLLACGSATSFADLCKMIYANYAAVRGKDDVVLLGDKNPHYCLFVKELIGLFPHSKFIHIVRDHRDNILSYQKVKFDVRGTTALAYRWKRFNQEILGYSRRHPDKFILLRYEDLLTNPEHQLDRICYFLGVDFDPVMLDFHKVQRTVSSWEWHRNLTRPLDSSRTYLWKSEMRKIDVRKSDYVCGEVSSYFGYENSHPLRPVRLYILTRPGVLIGCLFTYLERLVFYLPVRLGTYIINFYRMMTGSLRHA